MPIVVICAIVFFVVLIISMIVCTLSDLEPDDCVAPVIGASLLCAILTALILDACNYGHVEKTMTIRETIADTIYVHDTVFINEQYNPDKGWKE